MIEITSAHLKIFSAVFSDLIVVWLVSAFAATDSVVLLRDLVYAILMWYGAFQAEKTLEEI